MTKGKAKPVGWGTARGVRTRAGRGRTCPTPKVQFPKEERTKEEASASNLWVHTEMQFCQTTVNEAVQKTRKLSFGQTHIAPFSIRERGAACRNSTFPEFTLSHTPLVGQGASPNLLCWSSLPTCQAGCPPLRAGRCPCSQVSAVDVFSTI